MTPHSPHAAPGDLPPGLDPLAVGQSIFGESETLPPPAVEGYSRIDFLAEGGFGRVWKATRDADGVRVALKIPHQTDPETAERLEAEANALRSLEHPHIVRLLDVTDSDGAPVLVMELVEGAPLTTYLPENGFDFEHALQLFLPVLDAIALAHARGIIHRDLKPANILLADGTVPKVSDFGLAQSVRDQRVAFSLTRCGILAGTVEYLAPERYEPDSKVSAAADIFALGIILYEMLTGRPPRGAWEPLSQIKALDVRLDALVADAIHPDPARRLASASAFRQRLEEIRDSKPRFAGTPLATRPVRAADFFWTVVGLYCLAAGYCTLLSINNTDVPGIFDLRLGHTYLLGGYWALWILTVTMGLVWSWQGIRLWRFRHVPLREALPSPFGLRLGASKGTARLVALAQFLCAWAPLAYIGWIYSQVWFWATPDTAVWENVLAITQWGSSEPVSPWTWDPSGMFSGDEYWIREMRPGYASRTWQLLDRQSFLVVTQPLAMSLGVAGIILGILATLGSTFRNWRNLGLILLATTALAVVIYFPVREEADSRAVKERHPDIPGQRLTEVAYRISRPEIHRVFDAIFTRNEDPETIAGAFADRIKISDTSDLSRFEFLDSLRRNRQANQTVENFRERSIFTSATHLRESLEFELYVDPPGQAATGGFATLTCESLLSAADPPQAFITTWALDLRPLYSAEARILTLPEAKAWIEAFLTKLRKKNALGLEDHFLPIVLAPEVDDRPRESPMFRRTLANSLCAGITALPENGLKLLAPPAIESLPGARWRLTCEIRQTGDTRPRTHRWQFDLVPVGDGWKALRLRM